MANEGLSGTEPSGTSALQIVGTGAVTVVFESGLGDTGDVWQSVQSPIAADCAKTVSYTRRGYRGTALAYGPRDAEHLVAELRSSLREFGASPPYVLVGHSLGGLYMQYFARAYPGEVRGLLLVDSMQQNQIARVKAVTPGTYRMLNAITWVTGGELRREFTGIAPTAAEIARLPHAKNVATIVLSSTQPSTGDTPAFRTLMAQLQGEIAADFGADRHEFVTNSGHYIQRDQPQKVIAAARELAGCSTGKSDSARASIQADDNRLSGTGTARFESQKLSTISANTFLNNCCSRTILAEREASTPTRN